MKALDKDRNRRYANANGLAADLQRYLDDEPVSACPPSAAYRARKFVRRNKKIGGGRGCDRRRAAGGRRAERGHGRPRRGRGTRWPPCGWPARSRPEPTPNEPGKPKSTSAELPKSERDRALEAERQATRQRNLAIASEQKAQANFEQARDTVDRYLTTVSENQLLTVPGMQPLRQELLDSALTFYERFRDRARGGCRNCEPAWARSTCGWARFIATCGNKKGQRRTYAKAQELFEALVRDGHATPDTCGSLAEVYSLAGPPRRHGRPVQTGARGSSLTTAMRNCCLPTPTTPWRPSRVTAAATELNEVLRMHRDAFAIRRQLVELDPDNPEYLGDLSSTINNVGVVLGEQRQEAPALEMFRLGQPIWRCGLRPGTLFHALRAIRSHHAAQRRGQGGRR